MASTATHARSSLEGIRCVYTRRVNPGSACPRCSARARIASFSPASSRTLAKVVPQRVHPFPRMGSIPAVTRAGFPRAHLRRPPRLGARQPRRRLAPAGGRSVPQRDPWCLTRASAPRRWPSPRRTSRASGTPPGTAAPRPRPRSPRPRSRRPASPTTGSRPTRGCGTSRGSSTTSRLSPRTPRRSPTTGPTPAPPPPTPWRPGPTSPSPPRRGKA